MQSCPVTHVADGLQTRDFSPLPEDAPDCQTPDCQAPDCQTPQPASQTGSIADRMFHRWLATSIAESNCCSPHQYISRQRVSPERFTISL